MGQILVTQFFDDEKRVLAIYQHWNSFSKKAVRQAIDFLEIIKEMPKEERTDIYQLSNKIINSIGNGIGIDAEEESPELAGLQVCKSRETGIIACSESIIKTMLDWAHMNIYININELTADVSGTVFNESENWEGRYKEKYGEIKDLPILDDTDLDFKNMDTVSLNAYLKRLEKIFFYFRLRTDIDNPYCIIV